MSTTPLPDALAVFDRATVRRHRDRAAADFGRFSFLHEEIADRLVDRLDDTLRDYPLALDLGCHDGALARRLPGRKGIETVISADLSPAMAALAPAPALAADEEALPIAPGSVDLVVSNLSLHWVNDLPGALIQARMALRPDGLFLAAMLGGETLKELRDCLAQAEMEIEGGLSPRLSPFAGVRDAGALMQRAGFSMPVVDSDLVTVTYDHPLKLMADLRGMGESNAVAERRKGFSRRATLMTAAGIYFETYADADGRLPATFQVIYLTGWAPAPTQPQPLKPGSATMFLGDALDRAGRTG
jgi:SAM-dependent methyltransferase